MSTLTAASPFTDMESRVAATSVISEELQQAARNGANNIVGFSRSNLSNATKQLEEHVGAAASIPRTAAGFSYSLPVGVVFDTQAFVKEEGEKIGLDPMLINIGATTIGSVAAFTPIHAPVNWVGGTFDNAGKVFGGGIGLINKEAGEKVTGVFNAIGNPFHVGADTIAAPFKAAQTTSIAGVINAPSKSLTHMQEQLGNLNPNWADSAALGNAAQKMHGLEDKAGQWVKGASKNVIGDKATEKVAHYFNNTSAYRGIMQVSAAAGIAHQNVTLVHEFTAVYDKLANLYATEKGLSAEKVKFQNVLFDGDVSELYKEARKQTMGNIPAATALSVVSAISQWNFASNNNVNGIAGYAGLMGMNLVAPMLMNFVKPNSRILDLHEASLDQFEQYGRLSPPLIAEIIKTASSSFSGRNQSILVDVMAKHYSEQGFSPEQLFKEITSAQIAPTGYLLFAERSDKMAKFDLVDFDPNQRMQPLGSHQGAPVIPQAHIYSYTMIKNAGADPEKLTEAVKEFVCDSQPSFLQGGTNHDKLDDFAKFIAAKIIVEQIPAYVVVNSNTVELFFEANDYLKQKPLNAVNQITNHSKALEPQLSAQMGVA